MEYWSSAENKKGFEVRFFITPSLGNSINPIAFSRELLDKKTRLVYFYLLSFWRINSCTQW